MTQHARLFALAALVAAALAACSSSQQAPQLRQASGAATLPGGTSLAVTLTAPATGAVVAVPPGDVHFAGSAALGQAPSSPDTLLLLALDASPATTAAAACGAATTVAGCEIAALQGLLSRAVSAGTVGDVGAVIASGGAAAPLDLSSTAGQQSLVAPGADADADGTPDAAQALATVAPGGVAAKYTAIDLPDGAGSLGATLTAAAALATGDTRPASLLVLVWAGENGSGPAVSTVTLPAGMVVRAFSVGQPCDAASTNGTLADAAARGAAGSGCVEVSEPAGLAAAVAAVLDATLQTVALTVDGAPAALGSVTPALPAAAPATVAFEATVTGLAAGQHQLCVTATGADATGSRSEQACATVLAATIALAPAEATFELGTPGQTATVTATVAAGEAGGVAGVPVAFEITAGPNAGAAGTVTTAADGTAPFTWTARQHLEGLGTDMVKACFTDGAGQQACAEAKATWQDTTPPVVSCPAGPNPGGAIVPSAAAGFMRLVAVDAVDPAPVVFLKDTGSGTVFGPFQSGTAVKYTQAPGGKPGSKRMGGGLMPVLHVTGTGDPALIGEDAVGNRSTPLVCAVPPWNK